MKLFHGIFYAITFFIFPSEKPIGLHVKPYEKHLILTMIGILHQRPEISWEEYSNKWKQWDNYHRQIPIPCALSSSFKEIESEKFPTYYLHYNHETEQWSYILLPSTQNCNQAL